MATGKKKKKTEYVIVDKNEDFGNLKDITFAIGEQRIKLSKLLQAAEGLYGKENVVVACEKGVGQPNSDNIIFLYKGEGGFATAGNKFENKDDIVLTSSGGESATNSYGDYIVCKGDKELASLYKKCKFQEVESPSLLLEKLKLFLGKSAIESLKSEDIKNNNSSEKVVWLSNFDITNNGAENTIQNIFGNDVITKNAGEFSEEKFLYYDTGRKSFFIHGVGFKKALSSYGPENTALLLVDLQYDFLQVPFKHQTVNEKGKVVDEGQEEKVGALAVKGADGTYVNKVKEATRRAKNEYNMHIVLSQDWHTKDSLTFKTNLQALLDRQEGSGKYEIEDRDEVYLYDGKEGTKIFFREDGRTNPLKPTAEEEIRFKTRMHRAWPDHCIQNTKGAQIPKKIEELAHKKIQKGQDKKYESYSPFENEAGTPTELDGYLQERNVKTLIVYGLATNYCVKEAVMSALEKGYKVILVTDLSKGIGGEEAVREAIGEMKDKGKRNFEAITEDQLQRRANFYVDLELMDVNHILTSGEYTISEQETPKEDEKELLETLLREENDTSLSVISYRGIYDNGGDDRIIALKAPGDRLYDLYSIFGKQSVVEHGHEGQEAMKELDKFIGGKGTFSAYCDWRNGIFLIRASKLREKQEELQKEKELKDHFAKALKDLNPKIVVVDRGEAAEQGPKTTSNLLAVDSERYKRMFKLDSEEIVWSQKKPSNSDSDDTVDFDTATKILPAYLLHQKESTVRLPESLNTSVSENNRTSSSGQTYAACAKELFGDNAKIISYQPEGKDEVFILHVTDEVLGKMAEGLKSEVIHVSLFVDSDETEIKYFAFRKEDLEEHISYKRELVDKIDQSIDLKKVKIVRNSDFKNNEGDIIADDVLSITINSADTTDIETRKKLYAFLYNNKNSEIKAKIVTNENGIETFLIHSLRSASPALPATTEQQNSNNNNFEEQIEAFNKLKAEEEEEEEEEEEDAIKILDFRIEKGEMKATIEVDSTDLEKNTFKKYQVTPEKATEEETKEETEEAQEKIQMRLSLADLRFYLCCKDVLPSVNNPDIGTYIKKLKILPEDQEKISVFMTLGSEVIERDSIDVNNINDQELSAKSYEVIIKYDKDSDLKEGQKNTIEALKFIYGAVEENIGEGITCIRIKSKDLSAASEQISKIVEGGLPDHITKNDLIIGDLLLATLVLKIDIQPPLEDPEEFDASVKGLKTALNYYQNDTQQVVKFLPASETTEEHRVRIGDGSDITVSEFIEKGKELKENLDRIEKKFGKTNVSVKIDKGTEYYVFESKEYNPNLAKLKKARKLHKNQPAWMTLGALEDFEDDQRKERKQNFLNKIQENITPPSGEPYLLKEERKKLLDKYQKFLLDKDADECGYVSAHLKGLIFMMPCEKDEAYHYQKLNYFEDVLEFHKEVNKFFKEEITDLKEDKKKKLKKHITSVGLTGKFNNGEWKQQFLTIKGGLLTNIRNDEEIQHIIDQVDVSKTATKLDKDAVLNSFEEKINYTKRKDKKKLRKSLEKFKEKAEENPRLYLMISEAMKYWENIYPKDDNKQVDKLAKKIKIHLREAQDEYSEKALNHELKDINKKTLSKLKKHLLRYSAEEAAGITYKVVKDISPDEGNFNAQEAVDAVLGLGLDKESKYFIQSLTTKLVDGQDLDKKEKNRREKLIQKFEKKLKGVSLEKRKELREECKDDFSIGKLEEYLTEHTKKQIAIPTQVFIKALKRNLEENGRINRDDKKLLKKFKKLLKNCTQQEQDTIQKAWDNNPHIDRLAPKPKDVRDFINKMLSSDNITSKVKQKVKKIDGSITLDAQQNIEKIGALVEALYVQFAALEIEPNPLEKGQKLFEDIIDFKKGGDHPAAIKQLEAKFHGLYYMNQTIPSSGDYNKENAESQRKIAEAVVQNDSLGLSYYEKVQNRFLQIQRDLEDGEIFLSDGALDAIMLALCAGAGAGADADADRQPIDDLVYKIKSRQIRGNKAIKEEAIKMQRECMSKYAQINLSQKYIRHARENDKIKNLYENLKKHRESIGFSLPDYVKFINDKREKEMDKDPDYSRKISNRLFSRFNRHRGEGFAEYLLKEFGIDDEKDRNDRTKEFKALMKTSWSFIEERRSRLVIASRLRDGIHKMTLDKAHALLKQIEEDVEKIIRAISVEKEKAEIKKEKEKAEIINKVIFIAAVASNRGQGNDIMNALRTKIQGAQDYAAKKAIIDNAEKAMTKYNKGRKYKYSAHVLAEENATVLRFHLNGAEKALEKILPPGEAYGLKMTKFFLAKAGILESQRIETLKQQELQGRESLMSHFNMKSEPKIIRIVDEKFKKLIQKSDPLSRLVNIHDTTKMSQLRWGIVTLWLYKSPREVKEILEKQCMKSKSSFKGFQKRIKNCALIVEWCAQHKQDITKGDLDLIIEKSAIIDFDKLTLTVQECKTIESLLKGIEHSNLYETSLEEKFKDELKAKDIKGEEQALILEDLEKVMTVFKKSGIERQHVQKYLTEYLEKGRGEFEKRMKGIIMLYNQLKGAKGHFQDNKIERKELKRNFKNIIENLLMLRDKGGKVPNEKSIGDGYKMEAYMGDIAKQIDKVKNPPYRKACEAIANYKSGFAHKNTLVRIAEESLGDQFLTTLKQACDNYVAEYDSSALHETIQIQIPKGTSKATALKGFRTKIEAVKNEKAKAEAEAAKRKAATTEDKQKPEDEILNDAIVDHILGFVGQMINNLEEIENKQRRASRVRI